MPPSPDTIPMSIPIIVPRHKCFIRDEEKIIGGLIIIKLLYPRNL
jgi:hypothetical protein